MRHTPGPWQIGARDTVGSDFYVEVQNPDTIVVCMVLLGDNNWTPAEREAADGNLALILQAPSLLEERDQLREANAAMLGALTLARHNLITHASAHPLLFGALVEIEAAIKKAEGGAA
jgi:hypothetical protein